MKPGKTTFQSLLSGTVPLFLLFFTYTTAKMTLDFWLRTRKSINAEAIDSRIAEILSANIHWVVSITALTAFYFSLGISFAFRKPESDPALRSRIRKWLSISLLAGALHLLHGNYVLPEANYHATTIRKSIINKGDPAIGERKRSDREMGIGMMSDAIRKARLDIVAVEKCDASSDVKSKRISEGKKWISALKWEIAKKIQMALYFPLLAVIGIVSALYLRRIPKAIWRFLAAYFLCKLVLLLIFKGMIGSEALWGKTDASPAHAWLLFALVLLLSAICGYPVLKLLLGKDNPLSPNGSRALPS
jgi:hypothetical protein